MRRAVIVIILALVPIVALVYVMASGVNENSDIANRMLDKYIAYRGYTLRVRQIVRARRPWNFTAEMSAATIGDHAPYQTTGDFSGHFTRGPMIFQPSLSTPDNYSAPLTNGILLPYPPRQLECALVEDFEANTLTVVFIAQHQDLYNSAWVIHEPAETLTTDSLVHVGCNFNE